MRQRVDVLELAQLELDAGFLVALRRRALAHRAGRVGGHVWAGWARRRGLGGGFVDGCATVEVGRSVRFRGVVEGWWSAVVKVVVVDVSEAEGEVEGSV